jgi:DNA polymerase-3 subunit alpha
MRNFKRKDQLVEHWEDAQRMNLEVSPPNVNASDVEFAVANNKIHFALSAIKGCGGGAGEAIVAARNAGGSFKDIFDFCERVDISQCNRAAIETLIKAGAMDTLGGNRNQLLQVLDRALQSGASAASDRKSGQKSLFGGDDEEASPAAVVQSLPDVPELNEQEKLAAEKEVLGFYLSSHPLSQYEEKLKAFTTHTSGNIENVPDRGEVTLGGMLSSLKFSHTKNPKPGKPSKYVMFDLEDVDGAMRCILWPEDFAKHGELVIADSVVIVKGALDRRGGDEANLIVNEITPLDKLDQKYKKVVIRLDRERSTRDVLTLVREIVRGYPGECELWLSMTLDDGHCVRMKSESMRIEYNPELRQRIDDLLGPGNLKPIVAGAN